MPRPRLRPGEYGTVRCVKGPDGLWHADARYRRHDGQVKRAYADATTKSKAESRLREKIAERIGNTSGDLSGDSTVADLAALHVLEESRRDLAPNTMREIRNMVDLYINPLLGALTLRECTTPRVDRAVNGVAAVKAPQAKKMRWVLSAMFKRAVRLGALPASPVTAVAAVKVVHADPIALTLDELMEVRATIAAHSPAKHGREGRTPARDVLEFLVGTGCRPQEALGLAWSDVHLEDPVPWVRIHQQVQRVDGTGLVRTRTKEQDTRTLVLPRFALEMLRRRKEADPEGWLVFPSNAGGLKDPKAMRVTWNRALAGTQWDWVTQKVLRKTVATLVAREQGSELAAKQLGHASDAVTRKHYIQAVEVPLAVESMERFGA